MQDSTSCSYGHLEAVDLPFEETVTRLEAGLKNEGFGVLCTIDIQAKMKEKLGIDFPRYVILGACNPPIARQALEEEFFLGLLLPCNALVCERGGRVYAGVVDADKMLSVVGKPGLESMAADVNRRLRRALGSVRRSSAA